MSVSALWQAAVTFNERLRRMIEQARKLHNYARAARLAKFIKHPRSHVSEFGTNVRNGKTDKDRRRGATERAASNRLARASWQSEAKDKGTKEYRGEGFPYCSGKGNSSKAFKVQAGRKAA